jgi:predicted kinase
MSKIIMTVGIPGSGKSTWAKNFCRSNIDVKRVNKDDLRNMLDDGIHTSKNEQMVIRLQDEIINTLIANDISVIVDNTNLKKYHWEHFRNMAIAHDCEFNIMMFPISIENALERNEIRPYSEQVPIDVIKAMEISMRNINYEELYGYEIRKYN